jgi:hypothetical protein
MIPQQATKNVLIINQASTTNGATAQGSVDTKGYDYCKISVITTTSDNTTNNASVLKVQEGDTTSSYADVAVFEGDDTTNGGFTIPSAITAATNITQPFAVFHVDTRARKRYLNVAFSPVTTQVVTVIAELGRASTTPTTSDQATVVVSG